MSGPPVILSHGEGESGGDSCKVVTCKKVNTRPEKDWSPGNTYDEGDRPYEKEVEIQSRVYGEGDSPKRTVRGRGVGQIKERSSLVSKTVTK